MSLLKIGSVTEAVGENGTRWIHSRTVSQAPDIEPPMRIARNRATARVIARPAEGVATAIRRPRSAPLVGCLCGRVDPVDERLDAAATRAVFGIRGKPPGHPQVAEQDDEREHERPDSEADRRRDTGDEDRVEPDALVPQPVGPQVETEAEEQEDPDDHCDGDADADAPAHAGRPAPTAVIRTARGSSRAPPASTTPASAASIRVQDGRFLA